jgi:hypothetical protein
LYTVQTVILQLPGGLFGFLAMVIGSYRISRSKVNRIVTPKGGKKKESI